MYKLLQLRFLEKKMFLKSPPNKKVFVTWLALFLFFCRSIWVVAEFEGNDNAYLVVFLLVKVLTRSLGSL